MLANPRELTANSYLAFPILGAIIACTYSALLFSTFGILDDYTFLYNAIEGNSHTISLLTGAGRPLNALLFDLGFSWAGSIERLAVLRAITLIGIWLLACILFVFCRLHSVTFAGALMIGSATALLPSFQVYAAWAQHFTTPYAGVLALLSALLLTPPSQLYSRTRIGSVVVSIALLTCALLIYQPIAMFFCVGIVISLLSPYVNRRNWRFSRIVDATAVLATSMILGLLVFKLGQHLYPSSSTRYGLVQDLHSKLTWFLTEPLLNALSLYVIPSQRIFALTTGIALCVGSIIFLRRNIRRNSITLAYAVIWGIAAYSPNLATAENWASYRSLGAFCACILVMLVLLCIEPIYRLDGDDSTSKGLGKLKQYVNAFSPLAIVMPLVLHTQYATLNGLILPNTTELNNLASKVLEDKGLLQNNPGPILVRASSWTDSATRPMAYDEFGIPSSIRPYYAKAITELTLRSMNITYKSVEVISENEAAIAQSKPMIDYPLLTTSHRFKTEGSNLLEYSPSKIYPADITDINWTNGIWTNKEKPQLYSFVYHHTPGIPDITAGETLQLQSSSIRKVLKVDRSGNYVNVLVEGAPLDALDGYPSYVRRLN